MPLYVTSKSTVTRHGVFPIEGTPPTSITPSGTGVACIVGQFPWGPKNTLYRPTGLADFRKTFAPAGMTRTDSAYLMTLAASFATLYAVRVLGSSSAAAAATLASSTPTDICTVTLKYHGTEGNSVTCTVAAADDGDANHFNLTVTRTSASGVTTEAIKSINFSGTGTDSTFDFTNSTLIASITKLASGRPANGSTSCSSGANGTIGSSQYIGTAGSGNSGIALMETDLTIRHTFVDDPGNSDRAAVNAGLVSHAGLMTDRVAYVSGNSGLSASGAQSDVANYRSGRACYVDVWAYVNDDTDGTRRLIPPTCFAASIATQLPPSTSIAWKDEKVRRALRNIVALEADRGEAAGTNTSLGITTLVPFRKGGYCFEAGVVTDLTPGKTDLTRTNMLHFIGASIAESLASNVDAPNVPRNQQDVVDAIDAFLGVLKANRESSNVNLETHLYDYSITPIGTSNPQASIDAGEFTVEINAKTSASMAKIFPVVNIGSTVKVTNNL